MPRATLRRPLAWMAAVSAIALVAWPAPPAGALAAAPAHASRSAALALLSVSNPRPQLVSGGEVLLRVTRPGDNPRHRSAR
jgi:hypothetical protein